MGPSFNPNDIQSYMNQMRQPFMGSNGIKPEEIQKQVMESITQYLPPFMQDGKTSTGGQSAKKPSQPNYEVFETHDFVIARIPIDQNNQQAPRLLMDTNYLYISNLPNQQEELKIRLPSPIRPKNVKADTKDGILEVRMLKRGPEPMTEINVNDV